jgi:hypothetical protein
VANIKTRKVPTFDPYDIKKNLVDLSEDYFKVQNVDLYESGFLGYVIQSLTHLTSDMLFQNALAYNEAFLIKASLPSSVYNIATQLDYNIQGTTPAEGSLTLIIPISSNEMTIKIPVNSKVSTGSVPFKIKYNYYINKTDSIINISKQDINTGMITSIPYKIEIHSEQPCVVFDVDIWQIEVYSHDFSFESPQLYVFYEETISGFEGSTYNVIVTIEGELYHEISSLYQAKSEDKVYELVLDPVSGNLTVKFGNGIYGYLPKDGAEALITLYTTQGEDGNILAYSAKLTERILNAEDGKIVNITSYNPIPIDNGNNGETLENIKRHAIENISSAKRLVTEKDYTGFQGVTGLTDITALPVLLRRDVYGNEISFFIVKYDSNNNPIPTASIPIVITDETKVIKQGELVSYNDVTYRMPFKFEYDDTYDIPLGRYSYSLSNLSITPGLFITPTSEDILMGVRNTTVTLYPTDDSLTIIAEIYKLSEMDAKNIKAEIKFSGVDTKIPLGFNKTYADATTSIFSSEYINYNDYGFDPGVQDWTIYLYYDEDGRNWNYRGEYQVGVSYAENDVVISLGKSYLAIAPSTGQSLTDTDYWVNIYDTMLYNIYRGNSTIFYTGIPYDENITASVIDSNNVGTPRFSVFDLNFSYYENLNDKCMFSFEAIKLDETVVSSSTTCTLTINNVDYDMKISQAQPDRFVYNSEYIDLSNFPLGSIDWTITIIYDNIDEHYFNGNISILESGKRPVGQTINAKPTEEEIPRIELVRLGLDSIDIEKIEDNDSYKITCQVSKLVNNSSNKIGLNLIIDEDIYSLTFIGDTPEDTVIFESEEIDIDSIDIGSTTFRIDLYYNGELHSAYQQSAIFKHDLTPICYSNIGVSCDGTKYAYSVPVIKQEYYDDNLEFIDTYVLNQMAQFREQFTQFKMLTDRINMKFVKTFGNATNMQLNSYNPTSVLTYDSDFNIELPPEISVKVYVRRDTSESINSLINECKNVLYTFLTLKSGFHANIYKSEISRYLHNVVNDVEFCEVIKPTQDIVFNFDINEIPKTYSDVVHQYCPEFIWFEKDNISINVVLID